MDHEFSNSKMFQSTSPQIRKIIAEPYAKTVRSPGKITSVEHDLANRTVLASRASAILFHCSSSLQRTSCVSHVAVRRQAALGTARIIHWAVLFLCMSHCTSFLVKVLG